MPVGLEERSVLPVEKWSDSSCSVPAPYILTISVGLYLVSCNSPSSAHHGDETPGTRIRLFSFLVGRIVGDIEKLVGKRLVLMSSCSRMWTSVLYFFLSVVAEFALGFNCNFVNPGTSLAERLWREPCGISLHTFSTLE